MVGSRVRFMDEATPTTASVSGRDAALRAAREALTGLAGVLWQAAGADLGTLLGLLDDVCSLAAAGRVAVAREALTRGEVAASQAGSLRSWIDAHAPSLVVTGGTSQVATVVEAGSRPTVAAVTEAVCAGEVPVPVGVAVIREMVRLQPRLHPDAVPTVVEAMLTVGAGFGTRAVREIRARLLAEHGRPGEFQADQDAAAALISLSAPVGDELGAFTYQLVVDTEGKAVLEAAIGPLSAPSPAPDGTPDRRPARQRRGQALIEVCRRATAAATSPPTGTKTTLVVTMDWPHLRDGLRAGRVVGSTADGDLLAPDTMRKLACDADLIPAVLAGPSQVLDLGRTTRLFSPAHVKALWLRDRGCTFPGCSIPAHWCQAHHLRHWIDGGTTSLGNAGLLCARHHTVVHRDHLQSRVDGKTGQVVWDLTPGSYDRALVASGFNRWKSRSRDGSDEDAHWIDLTTPTDLTTEPQGPFLAGPTDARDGLRGKPSEPPAWPPRPATEPPAWPPGPATEPQGGPPGPGTEPQGGPPGPGTEPQGGPPGPGTEPQGGPLGGPSDLPTEPPAWRPDPATQPTAEPSDLPTEPPAWRPDPATEPQGGPPDLPTDSLGRRPPRETRWRDRDSA